MSQHGPIKKMHALTPDFQRPNIVCKESTNIEGTLEKLRIEAQRKAQERVESLLLEEETKLFMGFIQHKRLLQTQTQTQTPDENTPPPAKRRKLGNARKA